MKRFAPDYYKDFACIKGDCRHSCCIGWEIDIDEDSLAYYRDIGGDFGKRLEENIVTGEEGAHFRLGEKERCPFLNRDGLCDMIIALGEDSLCQICADHPRFRNFYNDREEIGLGLCCEAAASLILGRKNPVLLEIMDDDGEDEGLYEDEMDVLELRSELISLAQDRQFDMTERIRRMQEFSRIEIGEIDYSAWKHFLLELERLDEAWAEELSSLDCCAETPLSPEMEIPMEQLLVYLLFRHINADSEDLAGNIGFCIFVWRLIKKLLGSGGFDRLCNLARLYSSEIEYSDENIAAIIDELRRVYPQI